MQTQEYETLGLDTLAMIYKASPEGTNDKQYLESPVPQQLFSVTTMHYLLLPDSISVCKLITLETLGPRQVRPKQKPPQLLVQHLSC